MSLKEDAVEIVNFLLEERHPPSRPVMRLPVKIQHPDGSLIDAEFTGYYGHGTPSIGYPLSGGGMSHGTLRKGDRLLTKVPSMDEWHHWVEQQHKKELAHWHAQQPPQKPHEHSRTI